MEGSPCRVICVRDGKINATGEIDRLLKDLGLAHKILVVVFVSPFLIDF